MSTVIIEDLENIMAAYFGTAEYLPESVKDRRVLMSQDLGKILADYLHAHGVDVNWTDGSYRHGCILPVGYAPPQLISPA
ncbi:hypothetical protein [Mycobacteroides abscessus]|uniref:hypothetical protein n=1 Tax=Mycobacteroides abscessus TaxID=36809 RepID=UPI0009451684|nr:hypothetical protein [Mycobacteroides abscessus]